MLLQRRESMPQIDLEAVAYRTRCQLCRNLTPWYNDRSGVLIAAQEETLNKEVWFDGNVHLPFLVAGVLPFFFTPAQRALAAFRAI